MVQLDLITAFPSTNMNAVYQTLEAYGVPAADMELLKRMQTGSWYSVANSFGETAAYVMEKMMRQGDPTSPGRPLRFMDPFIRMGFASSESHLGENGCLCRLDTLGRGKNNNDIRVDTMLVTLAPAAVTDVSNILAVVQEWEASEEEPG